MPLLSEALKDPKCNIKELWFKRCNLRATSFEILGSVLTTNQHLREFNLQYSNLGEDGVTKLCQALIHPNCKLQILRLCCYNLRANSCEKLASILPLNQNLRELHLDYNDIGDVGVAKLCQMLMHPECKLQVLSLDSCGITTAYCVDLASVLCTNQTLAELSLGQNDKIGTAGVQLLCEGLLHPNCTIETLRLDSCGLTEECWEYLCSALRTNQSLQELDLYNNEHLRTYLEAEKCRRIKEIKQQNHRIQIRL